MISTFCVASLHALFGAVPLFSEVPDLLVVTPEDLAPAAEALAEHRRAEGLSVRVEVVDALAVEGALDPGRVKERVRELAGDSTRYLLLLGDAPAPDDAKGLVRIPPRILPARFADERWPHAKELASDVWYGMLDEDLVPELAVGRLPADDLAEATAMVERVIAYEAQPGLGGWHKKIEVVAGVAGFGEPADSLLESVARRYLAEGIDPAYDVTVTWAEPSSPFAVAPPRLAEHVLERFDAGALIAAYVGHAGPFAFGKVEWEGERYPIFGQDEARRLEVAEGAPLMILLACSTGWFDHRKGDCLSEVLLKRPRGPIAVFSSTRVSQPYADGLIGRALIEHLMGPQHARLGDSIRAVQTALVKPANDAEQALADRLAGMVMRRETLAACREDHVHLYTLFGDPSLKLAYPRGGLELHAPAAAKGGEVFEVTGKLDREYHGLVTVTIEAKRGHTREKTEPTTGMKGDFRERVMAKNWRRSNDLVLTRQQYAIDAASFAIPIQAPKGNLERGDYLVRAFAEDREGCAVASSPISVSAPTGTWAEQDQVTRNAFFQLRRKAVERPRRIIFNDDGNEPVYYMDEATPEALLAKRIAPLADSQVDSIFYCTWSSGFGNFTHDTKVGTPFTRTEDRLSNNKTAELLAKGLDPLKIVVDWGKEHDVEVFWSFRMNDTHDASSAWYGPLLFPPLKAEHPDWLVGSREQRPPNGRWTAVDYTRPEVRELAFRFVEEVCRNYDVDGIELDFFRHLNYFKRVSWGEPAGEEELAMMTDFLRRIREMVDEVGWERRRPILVAVRVPDTIELCRTLGLDVETWIGEGLIDLMTVGGYFRLEEWEWSVARAGYGVQVYACLSESRQRDAEAKAVYNSPEGYRSRALNAWHEGVDGIYLFNAFDPTNPMWHELGDPRKLKTLSKTYFTAARGYGNVESWWKGGSKYMHRSILSPDRPRKLETGKAETLKLLVGEDADTAKARTLRLRFTGLEAAGLVRVTVNGTAVESLDLDGAWLTGVLPTGLVQKGWNEVAVTRTDAPTASVSWLDLHLHVEREP